MMHKTLRYRWVIFWILACSYILVFFHRLCPAVLAVDMMRDLKVGGALTGWLGAAYFYPYAAVQLPAGLLSDSWGPRKTITLFFGIAIVGSVLLGAAPSVFWAILGRALVGLGVAMLFVPTMKILSEWFRVGEYAFMAGILMAMGGIGSLFAATPLVWLSGWLGWRLSFMAVGGFTLVMGILVWCFVRNRPADLGWPSPETPGQSAPAPIGLLEGVRKVLKCFFFWPVAVWFFCTAGIFFAFGGLWGGPYLMQIHELSKEATGQILSMLAIGMIVGSPAVSYASTNLFKARKPVLILSSIMAVLSTSALAFYTGKIPVPGLYGICLGLGIFTAAIVAIGFTTAKELFPVQMAGTATGMINIFPFAGGAVFQPLLGWMLERHGGGGDGIFTLEAYQAAFFILFLASLVALAASFFLKETLGKE